jgi:outer membrane protein
MERMRSMKRSTKVTAALALCLVFGLGSEPRAQVVITTTPAAAPSPAGQGQAAPSQAPTPAPNPAAPPIQLTLRDAIRYSLERNLDLKVELYNPAMAEAVIRRSQGIYDPLLNLGVSYDRTVNSSTFNVALRNVDQYLLTAGISKLLSTGGTVGVSANSTKVSNVSSFYSNGVDLSLSQPLLRNFGRETTELEIAVSRFNKEGSLERFRTRLSDIVAQVRADYFRLYSLRENLAVRRTSLELARTILEETRGRVRAGVLPAMEILNAEFVVATREKEVIDAERAVRDQVDVLGLALQLESGRDIVVVDPPDRGNYCVAEDEALRLAIASRPELAEQRVAIKIDELQRRVARNRTLPDLTLDANVGFGGSDREFTGGLRNTVSAEDPSWGIGLQFSYPLGNRAARNEYIRSKLALEQAQAQLQNLEAGIGREVRTAIRLVQANYKQIDVTRRGTAYAEERLRAFQKRNAVGLSTTKDVFDVEEDLVTARANEIQALVDYNNAVTQLWRVTGEILDRQGIRLSEQQADALYQQAKR